MKEFLIVTSSFCLIIALTLAAVYVAAAKNCENQSVSFDSHNYMFFGGCMVLHKDRWIPLKNIRGESF